MNKLNVSNFIKMGAEKVSKHSPEILLGLGIVGMISTTIMAVKATPKAIELLEEEKKRQNRELAKEAAEKELATCGQVTTLKPVEVVKTAWKPYVPAIVTGVVSVGCLIGSGTVNARRNAALAAAYTLSETAFSDYKKAVVETVGEKKEQMVKDIVAKEKVESNPVRNSEVIITERGNTLCYDVVSGRYFKSDIEKIRKVINELNYRMMSEMYISLNDLYEGLGLRPVALGYELGWNINKEGQIDIDFSSQLADNEEPCLVLGFRVAPRYDYSKCW